jgi:hypothetical protein
MRINTIYVLRFVKRDWQAKLAQAGGGLFSHSSSRGKVRKELLKRGQRVTD